MTRKALEDYHKMAVPPANASALGAAQAAYIARIRNQAAENGTLPAMLMPRGEEPYVPGWLRSGAQTVAQTVRNIMPWNVVRNTIDRMEARRQAAPQETFQLPTFDEAAPERAQNLRQTNPNMGAGEFRDLLRSIVDGRICRLCLLK